jgi:2-keto-4-pentenoate hydratase
MKRPLVMKLWNTVKHVTTLETKGHYTIMGDTANSAPSKTKQASDVLISHWQKGTTLAELPEDLKPQTIPEGYEVQSHILRQTSHSLWGWKIAATSIHGQKHINVDRPLAGRILQERVTPYGQKVSLGPNRMKVAELELAFRMGRDLMSTSSGKKWKMKEVMDAVDGLFLGVEVPDSRYEDFVHVGAAQLVADNACADKYILGPEVKDWKGRDLIEHKIVGWIEGSSDEKREGKGGMVLGDPRIAMTWIANELAQLGVGLRKGEYVTTGTCVFPLTVKPGDKIVGDYGDMGRIEVKFVE